MKLAHLTTPELIRIKRDGGTLDQPAIQQLIRGAVDGTIPEYQLAALLMAIVWRGMERQELSHWTNAMLHSGRVLDLSMLSGAKVDKHSTGGVGDKVSICLAPLVAACGVYVPMISGRGLGHTGGTLDKLEAIAGFRTRMAPDEIIATLDDCGMCLVGQSADIAPADRLLYALRDATATVESIPLIASSIMSKKLAEGIDALVLDVKVGNGAFMTEFSAAQALARTIVAIGADANTPVTAVLSDMNQPLGKAIGNANETREAIDILRGNGPDDLWQLTRTLGAHMLVAGSAATNEAEAQIRLDRARTSGAALERLRRCIELQGGNPNVVDDPLQLPCAKAERVLTTANGGYVTAIDTRKIGVAAMVLGAGRQTMEDTIDPACGITFGIRLGQHVLPNEPLCVLHYNDEQAANRAEQLIRDAITLSENRVTPPPLIYDTITG